MARLVSSTSESAAGTSGRADADLVFLTTTGHRWVWSQRNIGAIDTASIESLAHIPCGVIDATARLLSNLGHVRPGHGFYYLRHILETIGGELSDPAAVASWDILGSFGALRRVCERVWGEAGKNECARSPLRA